MTSRLPLRRLWAALAATAALTAAAAAQNAAPVEQAPLPPPAAPAQPAPSAPAPATPSAPSAPASPFTGLPTLIPNPGDPSNVDEVELAAKPVAILSGTSTWDDGFQNLKNAFKTIQEELTRAGIAPAGRPLAQFVETDDMGFRYDAMIPIPPQPEGSTKLTPEVRFGRTPEGKAYRFVHKDPYDEIDSTYETITAYLDAKNIVVKDAFIEEYVTDLTDSADANLEINVYVLPK
jgi:effector-binding domain-containing protein